MAKPMTMTQKILAARAGLPDVEAGQLVLVDVDRVLGNDITSPVAIKEFNRLGAKSVFDKSRVTMVMDHFAPNKDIKAAEQCKLCREFCAAHEVEHFYDVGEMGIEHALLPEKGLVTAATWSSAPIRTPVPMARWARFPRRRLDRHGLRHGDRKGLVQGARRDSLRVARPPAALCERQGRDFAHHRPDRRGRRAVPVHGVHRRRRGRPVHLRPVDHLQHGHRSGRQERHLPVDDQTLAYLAGRCPREPVVFTADADAHYARTIEIDLSAIRPTVAFPHLPENTRVIDEVGNVPIDQVVIGSCTNGHYKDLFEAASILQGRHVAKGVRAIIIPATQEIYLQAMENGLLRTFIEAGCVVSTPTCGPCLGGYMGILAKGERAVATTNRNFVGRMGHPESEVYLASPAVAAASAIAGRIAGPEEVL